MKHCWGDTCGNLFNAGGDIESSARLTLNAGWFTQICICVCSLKVQMVFPAPLHFHVGTKSHLCEGGAVWPSPAHHTGIARVGHKVWQQCPLISSSPILTPLAQFKPSFVCPHHLSQMFYLSKWSSNSGYVINWILIKFAEKGLGNGFHWVSKTWAAFKESSESRQCSTLISV